MPNPRIASFELQGWQTWLYVENRQGIAGTFHDKQ